MRVSGDAMEPGGIFDGDIIVTDNSLVPQPQQVVIAVVNGAFTIRRFVLTPQALLLKPDNPAYTAIRVTWRPFQTGGTLIDCL